MNRITKFDLIKLRKYFNKDYSYKVLLQKLREKHSISFSLRTLSRILKKKGWKRKIIEESPIEKVAADILLELEVNGYNLGYRSMWQRLRKVYHFKVKQKTVIKLLQVIESDGVECQSRYKLKRCVYSIPGPNYLWHSDGQDKLKRFGLAIYGIIGVYSKKVLCLEVSM